MTQAKDVIERSTGKKYDIKKENKWLENCNSSWCWNWRWKGRRYWGGPFKISFEFNSLSLIKSSVAQRRPKDNNSTKNVRLGGSPGLVVKGGDSYSEGCEFNSWHQLLDGHFFTLIWCKFCVLFVWKRLKINEKETGDAPKIFEKRMYACGNIQVSTYQRPSNVPTTKCATARSVANWWKAKASLRWLVPWLCQRHQLPRSFSMISVTRKNSQMS